MDAADRLERTQWDFFWVPEDTVVHERPELLYVASPRDVPHLNAVTRTDPTHPTLERCVEEVVTAHRAVRSRWAVPSRIDHPRLRTALRLHGYEPTARHHARALQVEQPKKPKARCEVRRVATVQELEDLIRVGNDAFERAETRSPPELEAELAQCTGPDSRVARFVAYVDGEPVSAGGITAFDGPEFGFLWAGCTVSSARGRGFYSAVVAARMQWAHTRGLRWAGVYARIDTSSPILERQGFGSYGEMTYWQRPADEASP